MMFKELSDSENNEEKTTENNQKVKELMFEFIASLG